MTKITLYGEEQVVCQNCEEVIHGGQQAYAKIEDGLLIAYCEECYEGKKAESESGP